MEYTFFSNSHAAFKKMDHSLSHKTYLDKFEKLEIIQCMLPDPWRINWKSVTEIAGKFENMWRLNNTQRRNLSREFFLNFELNGNENKTSKFVGCNKEVPRGKLNAYISKEERSKISNLSFHLGYQKKKRKLNPKWLCLNIILIARVKLKYFKTMLFKGLYNSLSQTYHPQHDSKKKW